MEDKQTLIDLPFYAYDYKTIEELDRFYMRAFDRAYQFIERKKMVPVKHTELSTFPYLKNHCFLCPRSKKFKQASRGAAAYLREMKYQVYKDNGFTGRVNILPNFSFLIGYRKKMPNQYVRIVRYSGKEKKNNPIFEQFYLIHFYELFSQQVKEEVSQEEQDQKLIEMLLKAQNKAYDKPILYEIVDESFDEEQYQIISSNSNLDEYPPQINFITKVEAPNNQDQQSNNNSATLNLHETNNLKIEEPMHEEEKINMMNNNHSFENHNNLNHINRNNNSNHKNNNHQSNHSNNNSNNHMHNSNHKTNNIQNNNNQNNKNIHNNNNSSSNNNNNSQIRNSNNNINNNNNQNNNTMNQNIANNNCKSEQHNNNNNSIDTHVYCNQIIQNLQSQLQYMKKQMEDQELLTKLKNKMYEDKINHLQQQEKALTEINHVHSSQISQLQSQLLELQSLSTTYQFY